MEIIIELCFFLKHLNENYFNKYSHSALQKYDLWKGCDMRYDDKMSQMFIMSQ